MSNPLRKEIVGSYNANIAKDYHQDLQNVRSKSDSIEGKRLQRESEKRIREFQKQGAQRYTSKVNKENLAKAAKKAARISRLAKITPAGIASGLVAPYVTKVINRGVDYGFRKLTEAQGGGRSGSVRKKK